MLNKPLASLWMITALAGSVLAADPPPTDSPDLPTINLRRTVTVKVVEKTKNAVVNISTTKLVNRRMSPMGFEDPFMQQFGQVVQVPASSLGSGFIIHSSGYVVTNNHVVDRARQIEVELANGLKVPAELISTDPDADLALLKIHSDTPLPVLDLGESNDLLIGEPVIAVGNPLGFSHTVSTGIVSAVHRDIDPSRQQQSGDQPATGEAAALRDLIQTDAAINPGNSGGPLLNAYGQVIGINTAIRGDAQNIGFAIPIDRLRDLIPELMNPAQVTKVVVPIKLAEQRTLTEPATIHTTIVSTGSNPRQLDSMNGRKPLNIVDAYAMLLQAKSDQPFDLQWTDGSVTHVVPKPAPIPDAIVQAKDRLGITIEQVTPMSAQKLHLSIEDGLLVTDVERGSVSAKAGIVPGDVLVQLGRYPVSSLDRLGTLLQHLPESGKVRISIVRGQEIYFGALEF